MSALSETMGRKLSYFMLLLTGCCMLLPMRPYHHLRIVFITNPLSWGPIYKISYDSLTIMPRLRSTYDERLIYKTSYEWRKAFYRALLCIRGTSQGPVSVCVCVCLSVCLSVTNRCSTKTAKNRITQTTPHDRPGTPVF